MSRLSHPKDQQTFPFFAVQNHRHNNVKNEATSLEKKIMEKRKGMWRARAIGQGWCAIPSNSQIKIVDRNRNAWVRECKNQKEASQTAWNLHFSGMDLKDILKQGFKETKKWTRSGVTL